MTCLFGWHDLIRDRDATGALILKCQDCTYARPVLQSEMRVDGPQHQPSVVAGQPKIRQVANVEPEPAKVVFAEGRFK